ncbi:hypothetical protein [Kribbella turkmenica]|uniref:hypothetical protein n=1 Tax=Kribbella turkmenica TaxID=2530375 RepID=UPI0014052642|nr:hypothetical protein [Kribbella turkmenica]
MLGSVGGVLGSSGSALGFVVLASARAGADGDEGRVVRSDAVGDHGGLGATGVARSCADGNQRVVGLPAGEMLRDGLDGGRVTGSRGGTPTRLGEVPVGMRGDASAVAVSSGDGRLGVVVADSCELNGTATSAPTNVTAAAASAPSLSTGGPPYRPTGPRTGRPFSSVQNAQPAGGLGQDGSGFQFLGGRHRAFGGSGHSGGEL